MDLEPPCPGLWLFKPKGHDAAPHHQLLQVLCGAIIETPEATSKVVGVVSELATGEPSVRLLPSDATAANGMRPGKMTDNIAGQGAQAIKLDPFSLINYQRNRAIATKSHSNNNTQFGFSPHVAFRRVLLLVLAQYSPVGPTAEIDSLCR